MCWIKPSRLDWIIVLHWITYAVSGSLIKITNPLIATSANKGHTITFRCGVTADALIENPPIRIRWKHNNELIDTKSVKYQLMENGQTLIIRDIEQSDAGTYTCVAGLRGYKDKDKCSAELTVKGPPDPPRNVEILTCPGRHQAELIWEDGNNNGEEIVSYLVQYNSSMNPFYWNSAYDEVTPNDLKKSNSYFINLAPWGKYSFRVLAKNSLGYSEPSKPTPTSCDTPPSRPFGNPQNVATKTDKMGKLIITWDPMPRMLHNGPGLSYVVSYRHKGSTYWNEKIVTDPNANELEIDVDDIYGLYEVTVKAKNSFGESFRPPYRIIGHSGEAEPLVSPGDFRLDPDKPVGPHTAHFIWESVDTSEENIRGKFRGYKLRYWKSSEGRRNWREVDIHVENSNFYPLQDVRATVNNLPPNTALRAQVSVMNGHYTGKPSSTIDFSTPEGVPGPVRSLREMEIKSNEAQLTWLPPDEPNGELVGYDIGYQPVNEDSGSVRALEPRITNPSTLIATIIGLQPDQEYRFFVWARTKTGKGTPVSIDVRTKRKPRMTYGSPNSQVASIHQGFSLAARTFPRNLFLILQLILTYCVVFFVFY